MDRNSVLISPEKIINLDTEEENTTPDRLINDSLSLIILAIAIVALAFSPILTKVSELELSPEATIFNRFWISTLIVGGWQFINIYRSPAVIIHQTNSPSKERGLLVLASFSATASALLWAISFTQTSIASSTVLRSLTPLFIGIGAWVILKQRFNRQFIVGMILAIVGAMVIGWDDLHLDREYLIGDGIALLSALLHGVNILTVGYLRDRGCPTERVLLWRCAVGSVLVFPLVCFSANSLFPLSLQGWFTVIALALVCQTFGQGLLVFSLKQFSSSFVGIFALLKPIVTALLAWVIFAERVSITSAIALILILLGIYLAKSSR